MDKNRCIILAAVFLACTSIIFLNIRPSNQSSDIPSQLAAGWNTIKQTNIQQDISFLASNQLQGRLSLSPGDKQAMKWIGQQLQTAGLKPAVGTSYYQAVPIIQYIPDGLKSYIALLKNGKKLEWKKPDMFMEFPHPINLQAGIIFVGYGITAPEMHYDDYASLDVKGKIVLVFEHEPQELDKNSIFNGKANTIYATTRTKALNAQKHGAIAVLIAPEPNRTHPSVFERKIKLYSNDNRKVPLPTQALVNDEIQIPVILISDKIANDIVGDNKLLAELQTNIDSNLIPRSKELPNATLALHNENRSRQLDVSYNVAGLLEGSDPKLKQETIIISAHHDHDGSSENDIWHGADDNASGTAGVLTLAQAFAKTAPKRSMLFVLFTAEERGLLGSLYMASHPLRPLATTRAMLNLDMIGRNETASQQTEGLIEIPSDTNNRLNLVCGHYSPDYEKTVKQQNKMVGLTIDNRFDNAMGLNAFFRSDQFPFVAQQVPACWWFTGFHPDYHETTDTADKINYEKMEKILQLAFLAGNQFANEEKPPRFVKTPSGR
jgi:hypothetical protein